MTVTALNTVYSHVSHTPYGQETTGRQNFGLGLGLVSGWLVLVVIIHLLHHWAVLYTYTKKHNASKQGGPKK